MVQVLLSVRVEAQNKSLVGVVSLHGLFVGPCRCPAFREIPTDNVPSNRTVDAQDSGAHKPHSNLTSRFVRSYVPGSSTTHTV